MTTKSNEMQKMQIDEISQWLNREEYKVLIASLEICKQGLLQGLTNIILSDVADETVNKNREYIKGQLAVIKAISTKEGVIEILNEAELIEESEDD